MPYSVVAEKLKSVPEYYMDEVSEFLDFLLFRTREEKAKNGLDKAIAEVEQGDVEVFNSFDDFKSAMSKKIPREGCVEAFCKMHKNKDDIMEYIS